MGGLIWLFFLIGFLFPDVWWGTHWAAFLPSGTAWLFLGLSLGLILLPIFLRKAISLNGFPKAGRVGRIYLYFVLGFLAGYLIYQFPIQDDNYGNAASLHKALDNAPKSLPDGFWAELLTPALEPGRGRGRVFLLAYGTANQFGLTIHGGYRLLDAVCGGLFVLSWLVFAGFFFERAGIRLLFLLAAFSAPALLIFFGHTESYAPGMLVFSVWMQMLLWFQRRRKPWAKWALLSLWLVATQINGLFVLLLPVLIYVFAEAMLPSTSPLRRIVTMKGMLTRLFLPLCALGLLAYFFVFGDHVDPRSLDGFRDIDRLFLPLFSPDPPLDRYNLLGFNHLFDLLNVVLFSAPGVLLLLAVVGIRFRNPKVIGSIDWNAPSLVASVFALFLMSAMLFMVNPLFSLPMDWDLYGLVLPAALAIVAVLLHQLENQPGLGSLFGPLLGLGLLFLPVIMVNHNTVGHANRLESVGIHVFRTYYIHSDRYLLYALNKANLSPDDYLARKSTLLDKLRPDALPGNDPKFGALLLDQFIVLQEVKQDAAAELAHLAEADQYMALTYRQVVTLMELHFLAGDFEAAHGQALRLIELGFPTQPIALRMGIHTALEAGLYGEAEGHCAEYLEWVPDDGMIREVYERLRSGDRVEELKELFSKG